MSLAVTEVEHAHDGAMGSTPNPRVDRLRRRAFTAEPKLAIVAEYQLTEPGAREALLRREGLYSSHLVEWRRARDAGALNALTAQGRLGRSAGQAELEWLGRRAERAEAELAKPRRR